MNHGEYKNLEWRFRLLDLRCGFGTMRIHKKSMYYMCQASPIQYIT
jgi:hypothetical protein